MSDLDKLREKAQAHHPELLEDDPFALWCRTCAEDWPCEVWIAAADPTTILALIDRLQRVETALQEIRTAAAWRDDLDPKERLRMCLVAARAALEGGSE
jgi:hypothetical protein